MYASLGAAYAPAAMTAALSSSAKGGVGDLIVASPPDGGPDSPRGERAHSSGVRLLRLDRPTALRRAGIGGGNLASLPELLRL